MTDFSSPSKRAIRVLVNWKHTICFSKPADCTSPSCTRKIEMLRGFFLIFVLAGIVIVAMCGFRGEHATRSPWEIFPDRFRSQKVGRHARLDFSAMGRVHGIPIL